jgi:hypothetical protein
MASQDTTIDNDNVVRNGIYPDYDSDIGEALR